MIDLLLVAYIGVWPAAFLLSFRITKRERH